MEREGERARARERERERQRDFGFNTIHSLRRMIITLDFLNKPFFGVCGAYDVWVHQTHFHNSGVFTRKKIIFLLDCGVRSGPFMNISIRQPSVGFRFVKTNYSIQYGSAKCT